MVFRSRCVGYVRVDVGNAHLDRLDRRLVELVPHDSPADLAEHRRDELLTHRRRTLKHPAQMYSVELTARGAHAAAEAHIFIDVGRPAFQTASRLNFDLLLGEDLPVVAEAVLFAVVASAVLAACGVIASEQHVVLLYLL